jgi:hypothetical protein
MPPEGSAKVILCVPYLEEIALLILDLVYMARSDDNSRAQSVLQQSRDLQAISGDALQVIS